MTVKDIKILFDRIKKHYNMFGYDDAKIAEWYKFLKDYDPKDIDNAFDKYLLDIHDNPPMVTSLTRGLEKMTDRVPEKPVYIACDLCGEKILIGNDWNPFEVHRRKCSKIDFIDREAKRIRGEGIDKEHYKEMTDEELNTRYRKVMDNWKEENPNICMNNLFQPL